MKKEKELTEKILGQLSTPEHMAKNGEDEVELAVREVAQ